MLGTEIFNPTPEQFGLRGDDYLWAFLRKFRYSSNPVQAYQELFSHFKDVVGDPSQDEIFIDWLAKGTGSSDGIVSIKWWREQGLPILKQRIDIRLGNRNGKKG